MKPNTVKIIFLFTLIILTGCANHKEDEATLDEIAREHERYLKEINPDSFVTIMNVMSNSFERLDKNYSPQMTDFHHWFDELMALCVQQNNKLILDVMIKKDIIKHISHFHPWCEKANEAINVSLAPYTALVAPEQIDKDNTIHTFGSLKPIVDTELTRINSTSAPVPFAYQRLLDQLQCTATPNTACLSSLFEKTIQHLDSASDLDPASLESIESYFNFYDTQNIPSPVTLWRYYEILATHAQ